MQVIKWYLRKQRALVTDEELLKLAAETDLTTLDSSYTGVTIDDVVQALDSNGNKIGYIVKSNTRGIPV